MVLDIDNIDLDICTKLLLVLLAHEILMIIVKPLTPDVNPSPTYRP